MDADSTVAATELQRWIERVKDWPEEAQAEVVAWLEFMEQELQDPYKLTPEDEAALEQGLDDVRNGRIASDEEVEALLSRYRDA